jgi:hypothetical protein
METCDGTSRTSNITRFQQNPWENHKIICLCKICELQSVKMAWKKFIYI